MPPIGFDRARKHKNAVKYANHNKGHKDSKKYIPGMYLTSAFHDSTKLREVKKKNKSRLNCIKFKNIENNQYISIK
jgi:hypothetical protein